MSRTRAKIAVKPFFFTISPSGLDITWSGLSIYCVGGGLRPVLTFGRCPLTTSYAVRDRETRNATHRQADSNSAASLEIFDKRAQQ